MIIFVLIGLILLFFAKRLASRLEYQTVEYSDYYHREYIWKDAKLPLWLWIVMGILFMLPIAGIIIYIITYIGVGMAAIQADDLRFKEGKESIITKVVKILTKEY